MRTEPKWFLSDSLLVSATRVRGKTAVVAEGREYTYEALADSARRLAAALLERGLERGDRVAIYMDNTWPCVVSIYGVALAGGAFVVINPQTKVDKLAFILDDSEAGILLTDAHLWTIVEQATPRCPRLRHVICSGNKEPIQRAAASVDVPVRGFEATVGSFSPLAMPATITPVDLAALIYTSGSTGTPKGVMHSHQTMTFVLSSLVEYLRLDESHVLLNVLPLAFDYGLYQLLMTVELGATLVLERSFVYPAQVFKRMSQFNVSVFPGVPTIFSLLISAHERSSLAFPEVRRVTNTAAALPSAYVTRLKEIFPNALIYKMYGLTECKRVSYLEPELVDRKGDSVGKAIPGTEVFLLDGDGNPAMSGEPGILHVRGPHVMMGYWKQPELTRHMLKAGRLPSERVLCTHDWFRTDEDGFLYFVGRSDDIIKTRGEKVSPVEVENVLYGIEGIVEAAVIGRADDILGERICAFVALSGGSALTDREIRKICLSRMENFMTPQEVIVLATLPKTETGKISKKDLREQYVAR